jgi:hypothetical protein
MAYLQVKMKERVFIRLPAFWAEHLPENFHKYCGVPLRLLKALYGYTYSGKFLYEEQAEFFSLYGLRQTVIPALWVMAFGNNHRLLVLHYSDDILSACTADKVHRDFIQALQTHLKIEHQPRASWYCRAVSRRTRTAIFIWINSGIRRQLYLGTSLILNR